MQIILIKLSVDLYVHVEEQSQMAKITRVMFLIVGTADSLSSTAAVALKKVMRGCQ